MMKTILVLYYSRHGSTKKLAYELARGIESENVEAMLRTVPEVSAVTEQLEPAVPIDGDPFVIQQDLKRVNGLALGSPTRFGNMAAPLKYFLDSTSEAWLKGYLVNKPGCVFTASSSLHGGQESTLLSMMIPLLHHGMTVMGLPYTEPELHKTTTGGSPYGVGHVTNGQHDTQLSSSETTLAFAQGKRLARLVKKIG